MIGSLAIRVGFTPGLASCSAHRFVTRHSQANHPSSPFDCHLAWPSFTARQRNVYQIDIPCLLRVYCVFVRGSHDSHDSQGSECGQRSVTRAVPHFEAATRCPGPKLGPKLVQDTAGYCRERCVTLLYSRLQLWRPLSRDLHASRFT